MPSEKRARVLLKDSTLKPQAMKIPPYRAKSGEIYVVHSTHNGFNLSDDFFWHRSDCRVYGKDLVRIRYYIKVGKSLSSKFVRKVYYLTNTDETDRLYLVGYFGDDKIATNSPINHNTNKSVLKKIKTKKAETPKKIYTSLLKDSHKERENMNTEEKKVHELISTVRDLKQCQNIKYPAKKASRIGQELIFNIYEISINIPDYI